jgi:hypothetical protein
MPYFSLKFIHYPRNSYIHGANFRITKDLVVTYLE